MIYVPRAFHYFGTLLVQKNEFGMKKGKTSNSRWEGWLELKKKRKDFRAQKKGEIFGIKTDWKKVENEINGVWNDSRKGFLGGGI